MQLFCTLDSVFTATVWFVAMKEFPYKWFRVTQYCGLWSFSTILFVFASNNDVFSAVGLPSGGRCTRRYCFYSWYYVFFPPPDTFSIVKKDWVFWQCENIYITYNILNCDVDHNLLWIDHNRLALHHKCATSWVFISFFVLLSVSCWWWFQNLLPLCEEFQLELIATVDSGKEWQ